MALDRNVGGTDRLVRAVLGTLLLVTAIGGVASGRQLIGIVAAAGASSLLLNAVTQFCWVNALLGIDTCSRSRESESS